MNQGVRVGQTSHGITVIRLHYSADEEKSLGEKVFAPEVNMNLSPWAANELRKMTHPADYLKEFEIDAEAQLGALLYQLTDASIEPTIEIDPAWTRIMSLDPHPGVPHAFLWCAVDNWGDRWYYRELWPSRVCYRWEGGMLLGKDGNCPADDTRTNIHDYVEVVKHLESADNSENSFHGETFKEKIYKRVIDYAARAFGTGTNDDPEQPNFQQRYEKEMRDQSVSRPFFDDAVKDHDVGMAVVNEGLKPRQVMNNAGTFDTKSRIHILKDRCPELIYQLKNNRLSQLSPKQAESQDPTGKPVKVRLHMTDNLRYIESSSPRFIPPSQYREEWEPLVPGIAY